MTLTIPPGPLSSAPRDTANYRNPSGIVEDAAWFYPEPMDGVRGIAGLLCFAADGVEIRVDG